MITPVGWNGFDAFQIENDALSVTVVPVLGAKIASLVDKAGGGDEWLAPPTNPVRERNYGDRFTDHDLAGWDEMFPTIDACPDPRDPRTIVPDHGEAWALPWEVVEQHATTLTTRLRGRVRPYLLTRTLHLNGGHMRLEYVLENHDSEPLPFLWAAHPLFIGTGASVAVTAKDGRVVNTARHPRHGEPDILLDWPGDQLNVVGPPTQKDYRKVYLQPEQAIGEGAVQRGRRALRMTWDTTIAPYLGIWIDEGLHTHVSTVALEPASGYYDALDRAYRSNRCSIAPVGTPVRWWLDLTFADRI